MSRTKMRWVGHEIFFLLLGRVFELLSALISLSVWLILNQ